MAYVVPVGYHSRIQTGPIAQKIQKVVRCWTSMPEELDFEEFKGKMEELGFDIVRFGRFDYW